MSQQVEKGRVRAGASAERPARRRHETLAQVTIVGCGSVGKRVALRLAEMGGYRFVLVDPKRYGPNSIGNQCTADEVGHYKTARVASGMRQWNVQVAELPVGVSAVPGGVLGPAGLLLVAVDNRRALIQATNWAIRMRAPMVRINIQPEVGCAAVQCFRTRGADEPCCVCSFTERMIADAHRARSCADPTYRSAPEMAGVVADEAASLACTVVESLVVGDAASGNGFGRERRVVMPSGVRTESLLMSNPSCHCNHEDHWRNLVWLEQAPVELSLGDVAALHGVSVTSDAVLRMCQRIATAGVCEDCRSPAHLFSWGGEHAIIGSCRRCDGDVHASEEFCYARVRPGSVARLWDVPLSDWSVPPGAIFEFDTGIVRSFVIGGVFDGCSAASE